MPSDGKGNSDFAYKTLKDRIPVILTQTIDSLTRYAFKTDSDLSSDAVKECVAEVSKLKQHLQTNKVIPEVGYVKALGEFEAKVWNHYKQEFSAKGEVNWFEVPWLFSECLVYRSLASIFDSLPNYDWFREQKEKSLHDSLPYFEVPDYELSGALRALILGALFGNQFDLSILADKSTEQIEDILHKNEEYLLLDDSLAVERFLLNSKDFSMRPVIMVLDNVGAELLHDFLLADFLVEKGLCSKVVFHVKCIPWFVSDVTKHDFAYTLKQLESYHKNLALKWQHYVASGKWEVKDHWFWTCFLPHSYIGSVAPDLANELAGNTVIFKGDLNYRKLCSDSNCVYTTPFSGIVKPLHDFGVSNIVAIRTCKSDPVVGLSHEVAATVTKDMLVCGKYGVISFSVSA
jgi:hypothetical protein